MATITVRNIPDEVHRAVRVLAARHGRSAEAEVRYILDCAVNPPDRLRLGDAIAAIGRDAGITDEDIDALEATFDRTPTEPMTFE